MANPVYKTRKRKDLGIDKELAQILEEHSEKTMIPESRIVDMALKEYFENHNIKKKSKQNEGYI